MGYELRRQLREALGPDITGLQRAIALEIADDANDETRCSYVTLETLARWTAAKDERVVRESLRKLGLAGWEFRVPIGKGKDGRVLYAVPGQRTVFKVPPFPVGEEPITVGPSEDKGQPRLSQGPTVVVSETTTVASEATTVGPFSSITSASSSISSPEPTPATAADPFDDFWAAYPKRVGKGTARRAWTAALKRGADPSAIVTAATKHADAWSRAGTERQWIPYPATWLNGERYDDDQLPTSPLPPTGTTGHQQPTHQTYADRGIF
ncbi:hypothetical protein [Streptomyces sp. YIM S03343]